LHNEVLHNLYAIPNVINVIKLRGTSGKSSTFGQIINAYKF